MILSVTSEKLVIFGKSLTGTSLSNAMSQERLGTLQKSFSWANSLFYIRMGKKGSSRDFLLQKK